MEVAAKGVNSGVVEFHHDGARIAGEERGGVCQPVVSCVVFVVDAGEAEVVGDRADVGNDDLDDLAGVGAEGIRGEARVDVLAVVAGIDFERDVDGEPGDAGVGRDDRRGVGAVIATAAAAEEEESTDDGQGDNRGTPPPQKYGASGWPPRAFARLRLSNSRFCSARLRMATALSSGAASSASATPSSALSLAAAALACFCSFWRRAVARRLRSFLLIFAFHTLALG